MTREEIIEIVKEKNVRFFRLQFVDIFGIMKNIAIPLSQLEKALDGKMMFDGSSIAGWKGINESDMILMPDPNSAVIDPFMQDTTVLLRCDVIEPATMQGYERDPRSIAKRGEAYLKIHRYWRRGIFRT